MIISNNFHSYPQRNKVLEGPCIEWKRTKIQIENAPKLSRRQFEEERKKVPLAVLS